MPLTPQKKCFRFQAGFHLCNVLPFFAGFDTYLDITGSCFSALELSTALLCVSCAYGDLGRGEGFLDGVGLFNNSRAANGV